jgi:hypothetical protein
MHLTDNQIDLGVMFIFVVNFAFDYWFVNHMSTSTYIGDGVLRLLMVSVIVIDNSQLNDENFDADDAKHRQPVDDRERLLLDKNNRETFQLSGQWSLTYRDGQLFHRNTPLSPAVTRRSVVGQALLFGLLLLGVHQARWFGVAWAVIALLVVNSGLWLYIVSVKSVTATYNRYSRLVTGLAISIISMTTGLIHSRRFPSYWTILKLAMMHIGAVVFLYTTRPRVDNMIPTRTQVTVARVVSMIVLLTSLVALSWSCPDGDTDPSCASSSAVRIWLLGISTMASIVLVSVWVGWSIPPKQPKRLEQSIDPVIKGAIRRHSIAPHYMQSTPTMGKGPATRTPNLYTPDPDANQQRWSSPVQFHYRVEREWVAWWLLYGWIVTWDWLLPLAFDEPTEWYFSLSPRSPVSTGAVSYDVVFLLLFDLTFLGAVLRQWRQHRIITTATIPPPVNSNTVRLVATHPPLQKLNWVNANLVIIASCFNFANNIVAITVYLSGRNDDNRWWLSRAYETRTQCWVEMGVLSVVLMSSLWPNAIEVVTNQCNENPFPTRQSSNVWWTFFYGWNYAWYAYYVATFYWYPSPTIGGISWYIASILLLVGCLAIAAGPWPCHSSSLWWLYLVSSMGTALSLSFERTVFNYWVYHLGQLVVIWLLLIVNPPDHTHKDATNFIGPNHPRCHLRFVLVYDTIYALVYLLYVATLPRLLDNPNVLAGIWRNFAINAISYLYLFVKIFTQAYLPTSVWTR